MRKPKQDTSPVQAALSGKRRPQKQSRVSFTASCLCAHPAPGASPPGSPAVSTSLSPFCDLSPNRSSSGLFKYTSDLAASWYKWLHFAGGMKASLFHAPTGLQFHPMAASWRCLHGSHPKHDAVLSAPGLALLPPITAALFPLKGVISPHFPTPGIGSSIDSMSNLP